MTSQLGDGERAALAHWSVFGRKGAGASADRVTASDRKTKKPMEKPITSPWDQTVPRAEVPKLLNGFRPQEMEDKWFVYTDGPDAHGRATMHLCRSWTGHKMAEVEIHIPLSNDGGLLDEPSQFTQIVWESSEDHRRDPSEQDTKDMVLEVCRWCMDVSFAPNEG